MSAHTTLFRAPVVLTRTAAGPNPTRCSLRVPVAKRSSQMPKARMLLRTSASASSKEPWHAVAREAMDEVVLENCMDAFAEGDVDALQECILEAVAEVEIEDKHKAKLSKEAMARMLKRTGSKEPWRAVAHEAMDELVLDNCLDALAEGDEGALQECLLEAETEIKIDDQQKAKQREEAKARMFQRTGSKEPWRAVAHEAMDEVVFDNCLDALAEGDAGFLQECLEEAETEIEIGEQLKANQSKKAMVEYLQSHQKDFRQKKK